ncbi:hypothetical protein GCM10009762_04080 [Dermacoccus barathri]|uniref:Uncharacterized protein n=1 Tax=Dermacoccus barathri TaxID=322601 RepID=A0ABN2B5A9_9MICO
MAPHVLLRQVHRGENAAEHRARDDATERGTTLSPTGRDDDALTVAGRCEEDVEGVFAHERDASGRR